MSPKCAVFSHNLTAKRLGTIKEASRKLARRKQIGHLLLQVGVRDGAERAARELAPEAEDPAGRGLPTAQNFCTGEISHGVAFRTSLLEKLTRNPTFSENPSFSLRRFLGKLLFTERGSCGVDSTEPNMSILE